MAISYDHWHNYETKLPRKTWVCKYCGAAVGSTYGYYSEKNVKDHSYKVKDSAVYICPMCASPTYYEDIATNNGVTDHLPGTDISGLPQELEALHKEMRICITAGCYTSAVLVARKMLMHMSVDKGAVTGRSFKYYVKYLSDNHYVPPNSDAWVDHIREKGNEANHEIVLMDGDEAMLLLRFLEGLFRINYEFIADAPQQAEVEA